VATFYPESLKKLVILNVPYPSILRKHYREGNIEQLLKSWYIAFFQIPALPEFLMGAGNAALLARMLWTSGKPDTFSEDDIQHYKEAWKQSDAIRSMLNWYRALARKHRAIVERKERHLPIQPPTLMLWGEKDIALSKKLAQPSIELCEQGELIFFPAATHWVQHDESEAVNQHLHRFLSVTEIAST
jgi:pimeloyl-ACP methyl ester carboxylesterase